MLVLFLRAQLTKHIYNYLHVQTHFLPLGNNFIAALLSKPEIYTRTLPDNLNSRILFKIIKLLPHADGHVAFIATVNLVHPLLEYA